MNATTFILVAVLLAGAWLVDRELWRRKSRDKLIEMLHSDNWRRYKPAILELRRRGEDVTVHVPKIVALLLSKSKVERAAAKATIGACFPDLAKEVAGYSATADLEACRIKAGPLLSRFPIVR
jgi:hypothetical protein